MFKNRSNIWILLSLLTTLPILQASTGSVSYEKLHLINKFSETNDSGNRFKLSFDKRIILGRKTLVRVDTDSKLYLGGGGDYELSFSELNYKKRDTVYGIQKLDWSKHSSYWLLDHVNGRRSFTLLDDKPTGVLGVKSESKISSEITASVFGSFLHLPSMSPRVWVKNGKVNSRSEWLKAPPTSISHSSTGRELPLYYKLVDDDISNIVLQKSVGASFKYGDFQKRGFEVKAFGLYKPESRLRYNIEGDYVLKDDRVEVLIKPIVNHQFIYGLEAQAKVQEVTLSAGFDVNDPNASIGDYVKQLGAVDEQRDQSFPTNYDNIKFTPSFDKESYFYAGSTYSSDYLSIGVNYIYLLSSNVRSSDDFFSETVKWKNAVGFFASYSFSDALVTSIDYKYDLSRDDIVLSIKGDYNFNRRFSMGVSAELVKAPRSESYWGAYRTKDSLYTNFSYVF